MEIKKLLLLLFGITFSASAQLTIPPQENILGPEWSHNQPLYEINIERASPEGNFKGFEKNITVLKDMGVGIVWLQPITARSHFLVKKNYVDSLGGSVIPVPEHARIPDPTSPYNGRDYYEIHDKFGSEKDFKNLVKTIHKNDMHVIIDVVINHTGWDHVFIEEHPEFYVRNENGTVGYTSPWRSLAQLDYTNKDLWKYMEKLLVYYIDEFDVDGFRTDVTDRFPMEFWNWVVPRIKKHKDVFMLAEGHAPAAYPSHSMTYDWFLSPAFWSVVHGRRNADVITDVLKWEQEHYPEGFRRLRHATNHDIEYTGYAYPSMTWYFDKDVFDKSWFRKTPIEEKFGEALESYMVLCATLPFGQPMIWTGQEYGVIYHTPDKIPFETKYDTFYQKMFRLYMHHTALVSGGYQEIPIAGTSNVYAFKRWNDEETITVIINLGGEPKYIPMHMVGIEKGIIDYFNDKKVESTAFTVAPWGYRVFIEKS
ncbi:alpha-amylase family glycosyl hydrolase [Galbibacter mesophilus]|uniref:alpha-amylase family glycosyl hydrolase n=1 Tax=Galbibacter mesophilus TaxID=379069 RepID=UPI00191EBF4F|nr:alpha-amylase family glycosyl hydrolase [Galbibacter mesophilus]MCM5663875.1 alpha-amylase family glycosyl hydrolase [Galbibacter mesophilus]